ncbi:M10 family metallopeptidase C-terminal domain-containing protein, partial [Corallococcus exiguus]|uniref:M10 family metallopeptidase C-terminal domain-containing protein n=1 Tax=Corallococcus exiguus TaxID=83462 RepID=UPI001B8D5750
MTYRPYVGSTGQFPAAQGEQPQTYMMQDIAALQRMYGANFETNSGDTVYSWNPSTGETLVNGVGQSLPAKNRVFLTIWDGGGKDTYDLSNYSTHLNVDLAPGSWSVFSKAQLAFLGKNHYARGNVFNALLYDNDP